MHLTGEMEDVGVSAETICARTANVQAIMLENALMLQFVTIAVFLGTLLQSVLQSRYVGIAGNLVTWPVTAQMKASATPVVRLDIALEIAQLPQCHLGT